MGTEIKNLKQLFLSNLKPGQKFVSYQCKKGKREDVLEVEVKILNEKNRGEEEIIYCVAKTRSSTDLLWKPYNTGASLKKEIAVYTTVIPALNEYAKEKGINNLLDLFTKNLGARISLDSHPFIVDENAVLLMENLTVQGYEICDRFTGFDIESTKLILRDLSLLHAVPIAYKVEKPFEFRTRILPYLKNDFKFADDENYRSSALKLMERIISKNPKFLPHLPKLKQGIFSIENVIRNPPKLHEAFATFIHNDYWTDNIFLKFQNGKPIKNKMVDFQVVEYNSLAHDILFFLYTSVELSVLENHADELIRYYYDNFIDVLTELECNTSLYPFDEILREFQRVAKEQQFGRILLALLPILTSKKRTRMVEQSNDLEDIDWSSMANEEIIHENYFKRLQFVVMDFVRKEWI